MLALQFIHPAAHPTARDYPCVPIDRPRPRQSKLSGYFTEIPYSKRNIELFSRFAGDPWSLFLDGCADFGCNSRYDLIVFDPYKTIIQTNHRCTVTENGRQQIFADNPFDLIKTQLTPLVNYVSQLKAKPNFAHLPFLGGAVGNFCYEAMHHNNGLAQKNLDSEISLSHIGLYDCFILVDHQLQKSYWLDLDLKQKGDQRFNCILEKINCSPTFSSPHFEEFHLQKNFSTDIDATEYRAKFNKIIDYIYAGDCYQINYSQRLTSQYIGHPWKAYLACRESSPAPYSAYMHFPDYTLLSHSPECFVKVANRRAETKPIKGTRPRSRHSESDQDLIAALRQSEKDRAENLMIVDLMRNDISRNCQLGSVCVSKLFDIESYSNVHHMVSTISGQLKDNSGATDLLRDCFPGGSITGAPKQRAMEIIDELENGPRGPYCGSLGYISADGQMNTNIAIRTLLCQQQNIYCWGGGGIVADSSCDSEYEESLIKINNLESTLNKL